MLWFAIIWCGATLICVLSMVSSAVAALRPRLLAWTGGLLLGIGLFWVLPELAAAQIVVHGEIGGWLRAVVPVAVILALLLYVDQRIYPICPFCATGVHTHGGISTGAMRLGWPLLLVGCLHSFLDGWAIALAHVGPAVHAYTALSSGAIVHKAPESIAVGILAARFTSSRKTALAVIAAVQVAMALGAVFAFLSQDFAAGWADALAIPTCACLLLFGLLALQEEWRHRGRAVALRSAVPGVLICLLLVLASK